MSERRASPDYRDLFTEICESKYSQEDQETEETEKETNEERQRLGKK
jgi:hypothetical protein